MLKRILSLACCLSLTVGLFTYRPPEAKAVLIEASIATSVLWTFMQSAGITITGDGYNSSEWAKAIEPRLREFTEWIDPKAASFWSWLGYEDGVKGFLKDLAWSAFDGPSTVPGYKIHVPAPVAKKFADFTSWFAEKMGLSPGSGPVPVIESDFLSMVVSNCILGLKKSNGLEAVKKIEKAKYRYAIFTPEGSRSPGSSARYHLFISDVPVKLFYVLTEPGFIGETYFKEPGVYLDGQTFKSTLGGDQWLFTSEFEVLGGGYGGFLYKYCDYVSGVRVSDYEKASSITVAQPGALSPTYDDSGDKATVLTVPGIEGQVSSINDLLQKILDKLAANELDSSASLEGEAAPDVPATDIGWKGTIEKIYQGIIDLPGRIAEAIKDLFIPHEGYAAEFVSGLTGAYQGRFGLLTYPFSVLGDFVGTVATLDEQEPILRWNDVKWQDHVVIAKGEYNLKSAIAGTEMQTVYQVYRTVASAALIVGFLHLCIRKLREVQSN